MSFENVTRTIPTSAECRSEADVIRVVEGSSRPPTTAHREGASVLHHPIRIIVAVVITHSFKLSRLRGHDNSGHALTA